MELVADRGVNVEMVAKGEEMVANGCPLKAAKPFDQTFLKFDAKQFAQAFLKLDMVQVHGWAMGKGKKTQKERRGGALYTNTQKD